MLDTDLRDQITRLEARIEELTASIERCHKIAWLAKIVLLFGGSLAIAIAFGAVKPNAASMICATSALIGGVVLLGANSSTAKQMIHSLREADALRAHLIAQIELRTVTEPVWAQEARHLEHG